MYVTVYKPIQHLNNCYLFINCAVMMHDLFRSFLTVFFYSFYSIQRRFAFVNNNYHCEYKFM